VVHGVAPAIRRVVVRVAPAIRRVVVRVAPEAIAVPEVGIPRTVASA
jgi:hypothetical protein